MQTEIPLQQRCQEDAVVSFWGARTYGAIVGWGVYRYSRDARCAGSKVARGQSIFLDKAQLTQLPWYACAVPSPVFRPRVNSPYKQ